MSFVQSNMVKFWIFFVTFCLLFHVKHSQDVIDEVWADDFADDSSGLTGWAIWNGDTTIGNLGNPTIQGNNNKFHGLFTKGWTMTLDSQMNYMYRYFSCTRRSTISISFRYASCKECETGDWVKVYIVSTLSDQYSMKEYGGTPKLDTIEGSQFQNALSGIWHECDNKNEWYYKTVWDFSGGDVEKGITFFVAFQGRITSTKEYWALFDIEIECIALQTEQPTPEPTASPTTAAPTAAPSIAPSIAPTLAPTQAPSNFGSPTRSPTLTLNYVHVRTTGCDYGDCGSPRVNYTYACKHQEEQIGAAY
eukprot:64726_1